MTDAETIAKQAAAIAADKKASRILVFDLKDKSDISRYKMICSGANDRQTKAIASAIEEHFKKNWKIAPVAVEGRQSGHWILLDYGSTMIHIFFDYVRDYYALEELWADAKKIDLPPQTAPAPSLSPN